MTTFQQNLTAIKRALGIHAKRSKLGLHGTRFMVRETIFYKWECRGGKGKWNAPEFISEKASRANDEDWTYEHAIPLSLVVKQVERLGSNPSLKSIRGILSVWDIPAVVTKGESKTLRKLKLQAKMPDGWAGPKDPFARYKKAKIKLGRNTL